MGENLRDLARQHVEAQDTVVYTAEKFAEALTKLLRPVIPTLNIDYYGLDVDGNEYLYIEGIPPAQPEQAWVDLLLLLEGVFQECWLGSGDEIAGFRLRSYEDALVSQEEANRVDAILRCHLLGGEQGDTAEPTPGGSSDGHHQA